LDRVKAGDVIGRLHSIGTDLALEVEEIIRSNGLIDILSLSGHASWKFLNWKESHGYTQSEIKTYFMQEMFSTGVLVLATHNVSLAHNHRARKKIANSYGKSLSNLQKVLSSGNLRENLRVIPLEPLFKVR